MLVVTCIVRVKIKRLRKGRLSKEVAVGAHSTETSGKFG